MKKILVGSLFFSLISVLSPSCSQKEDQDVHPNVSANNSPAIYLDGKKASASDVEIKTDEMITIYSDNGIYVFSNETTFKEWAVTKNDGLELINTIDAVNEARDFAISSGEVKRFEIAQANKLDYIPSASYKTFLSTKKLELIKKNNLVSNNARTNIAGIIHLYDFEWNDPNRSPVSELPMLTLSSAPIPVFPRSARNRASSYVGYGGRATLCDLNFFAGSKSLIVGSSGIFMALTNFNNRANSAF